MYLTVRQNLFDETVVAKRMKANDYEETVRDFFE